MIVDHLPSIARHRIPATPDGFMRLHRLERPEPWPEPLSGAMRAAPPGNLYPDYASFADRLKRFAGIDRLVLGAGIEDLVRNLFMLHMGRRVAFTWPTCAMFDVYAEVFRCDAVRIPTPFEGLALEAIGARLAGVALLILPNPGQPVDTCFSLADLRTLASWCQSTRTVLAIDEAYHGFGAPTALPLVDEFDNVVVLRTFSKAFGGAGLRIGYAVAGERLHRILDAVRQSGEVAGPSMHAVTAIMDHPEIVQAGIAEVVEGRNWLCDRFRYDGYEARGEYANHVLVDVDNGHLVAERLAERRVLVRANGGPLADTIMVTCGSRPLMERFYEVFRTL